MNIYVYGINPSRHRTGAIAHEGKFCVLRLTWPSGDFCVINRVTSAMYILELSPGKGEEEGALTELIHPTNA